MNKERRNKILMIIAEIEKAKTGLENILSEEEMYFDNMPENLQGSARGEESEEAIDYIGEAITSLDSAIEQLEEI